MRLTVIPNDDSTPGSALLRKVLTDEAIWQPLANAMAAAGGNTDGTRILVPKQWNVARAPGRLDEYDSNLPIGVNSLRGEWLTISNGRYSADINQGSVLRQLNGRAADVVAITADPRFQAGNELVRIAASGQIAGFRRFYTDAVLPGVPLAQWPHLLLVRLRCLPRLAPAGVIPADFGAFVSLCIANKLAVKFVQTGGAVHDLTTEYGLLELLTRRLGADGRSRHFEKGHYNANWPPGVRIVGRVFLAGDVEIEPDALIVGPSIVGRCARIGSHAFIRASVIGSDACVPSNAAVENRVFLDHHSPDAPPERRQSKYRTQKAVSGFRLWPRLSYARLVKRAADLAAAIVVLALFAPVMPIIALAIKLTSPGPVFFGHKREGLHGVEFDCLKFRTMIVGSDRIQQRLRSKNQVDGPQFKMDKDPRITAVGRFLRDTFIDEIPQFINILRGEMSVVGPRPSPRAENVHCAAWRDCRLSVRPGITGLWQVCRTRKSGCDFQEWIYYDTRYVRQLSLGMDLLVVWKTLVKLTRDFVNQF